MHKSVFATIAGTATAFAAASVYATDGGKAKIASAGSFAALDLNGDHRISRSEAGFDRMLSQTFAEIDTDGDGFVTPAEFATAESARASSASIQPHR